MQKAKSTPRTPKNSQYYSQDANDFFNVGGSLFNSQHYYPQAYEAFMVYADMPGVAALAKSGEQINESQRATAYFNAGLAAYSGNEVTKAPKPSRRRVSTTTSSRGIHL